MGEATYYCEISRFIDVDAIRSFFKEGVRAYDYWQEHRFKKCRDFWQEFKMKFREITEYLLFNNLFGGDCNNALAGTLDFGTEKEIDDAMVVKGDVISYHALVWHFANWDFIARYLKHKYHVDFKWFSDEYENPEQMEQEDCTKICYYASIYVLDEQYPFKTREEAEAKAKELNESYGEPAIIQVEEGTEEDYEAHFAEEKKEV